MKKSTTYRHFKEQIRYEQQHPEGFTRLEVYLARLTAMIHNQHIDPDKTVPATTEEYIIDFADLGKRKGKEQQAMTLEETEDVIKAIFGG